MKTLYRLIGIIALSFIFITYSCSDKIVPFNQLPQDARDFVSVHFPDVQVSYAMKDDGKYEVRLSDGTEINFTGKGEWDKVDCNNNTVPAGVVALLPEGIPTYVESNFPDAGITKIDKEPRKIDIELGNNLDLEFNINGKFLRVDD